MADENTATEASESTTEATAETNGGSLLTDTQQAPNENAEIEQGSGNDDSQQQEEKTDEQEGAPEKYEFKAPEGFEGELNQAAIEEFEPIARELNLNQEQAQKLVDLYSRQSQAAQQAQIEQYKETQSKWVKDLRGDSEFGGTKFDANVKHAQRAVQEFGSDGVRSLLDESGLGNHPDVVKMFAAIGKRMAEDSPGQGNGRASQKDIPIEERMYGKIS